MRKLSWNKKHWRAGLCVTGVLLALGLAIGTEGVTSAKAAKKIPISSAQDFVNIEKDPDGSYYLTKDITLPKEMMMLFGGDPYVTGAPAFTGTLDGKGHKIKGFTYQGKGPGAYDRIALFGNAENATFKNLSITGVNISVNAGEDGAAVYTLVSNAERCKFDKVNVSGKITVKADCKDKDGTSYCVGGLAGLASGCSFSGCKSSLDIKVTAGLAHTVHVGGLVRDLHPVGLGKDEVMGGMKNCSFTGSITASAKAAGYGEDGYIAAGLCVDVSMQKLTGCSNSGNITLKVKKGSTDKTYAWIGAYGITGGEAAGLVSCKNSGTIKAYAPDMQDDVRAAGLIQEAHNGSKTTISKCRNTGNVSAAGKKQAFAGGLCLETSIIDQSFNKGSVSAKGQTLRAESAAGGLCTRVYRVKNCYNVGKVSLKGSGYVGGLSASIDVNYGNTTNNYSIGTVTAFSGMKNGAYAAALFPHYEGVEMQMKNKCMIYDNYYNGCARA